MDPFNLEITSHDFKAEPVVIEESFAIFLEIRSLFYHFVVVTEKNDGDFDGTTIYQVHIHRHEMSGAYAELLNRRKNETTGTICSGDLSEGVRLCLGKDGDVWIHFDFIGLAGKINTETGQWFVKELEKDFEQFTMAETILLEKKARSSLARKFGLPEQECDFSQPVWHCLQFEKQLLTRRKKPFISVSDLYRQFTNPNPDSINRTLSAFSSTLHDFDPKCDCEFCMEIASLFERVQELYFPRPFYVRGKPRAKKPTVRKAVENMFNRLSPRDQYSLIFLAFASPMIVMTLGWFAGLKTTQSLISLVCTPFQPDSPEEQLVREEIATVQYFRKLV